MKIYELINNKGLELKSINDYDEILNKINNKEKIFFKKDNLYYKLTIKYIDTCKDCVFLDAMMSDNMHCQGLGCVATSLSSMINIDRNEDDEEYYILKLIDLYEIEFGGKK